MIGFDSGEAVQSLARTVVHRECELSLSASIVTIGAFDGVHRGHQALLARVVSEARQHGVPSVVYTFETPPKVALGRVIQLTPPAERIRRLSLFEVDHIIMARFDRDYASRPAASFIEELGRINPRGLWVGTDFRFGKERLGDVALLDRYFPVRILADVAACEGERISSSRLRALISEGRHEEARLLHGWPDAGCLPGTAL
ncbi:FAD synthetase family protein [Rhizobium sp. KVB221]|uniref:FAD synthase n=1 Tax=Rhizobium setariae TaxID=2801340 RepID=A0A937CPB5_9HYPH|nr:FAD synthetase family protein [Rhizobium setariae]MBL0372278.1 FAD synthetase family protein [Rhizobium setariae]